MRLVHAWTLALGLVPTLAFATPGIGPQSAFRATSPSGRYSFTVEEPAAGDHRLIVRERGVTKPVAHIDMPGTRNLEASFVGGDNVLAQWSCGSPCASASLFSPTGGQLAEVVIGGAFDVSPNGSFAVGYDASVVSPFEKGKAAVVDLRTGETLRTQQPDIWNVCSVHWGRARVTLSPCDGRTKPIRLPLPGVARRRPRLP
jgi:hypothetical protein